MRELIQAQQAELRGVGFLTTVSPSGVEAQYPPTPGRVQRFRVMELGVWTYEWESGSKGQLKVVRADPPPPSAPAGQAGVPGHVAMHSPGYKQGGH